MGQGFDSSSKTDLPQDGAPAFAGTASSELGAAGARVWVGRVAQAVAAEVEGEDDDEDGHHREHQPRVERDDVDVLCLVQQHAPARHRRAQAEAEEGERGFAEDHRRHREGRRGDQVARERGQQVAADDACGARAHQDGGGGKVLLAQREQLRAHGAREAWPVEEGEDDGDAEVNQHRAPVHGQRRRERHPQRQLREGAHHLDEALDDVVEPAAVVAGDAAEGQADGEADDDAEEADGERDARAIDDAAEKVAAQAIGAQYIEGPAFGRADEVQAGIEEAPEAILVAQAQEAQAVDLAGIVGVVALQVLEVELHVGAVHERPDKASLVEEMQPLRRRVDVLRVARGEVVGRDQLAHQDRGIERRENDRRGDRDAVAAELPPHDLPLRGAVEALLLRGHRLRGVRIPRLARDVVRDRAGGALVHRATPPVRRMRGSSTASSRSDMNMPITVRSERNIRKEPARYWSWLFSASSSIGPEVCSESTTATIAEPEITEGSRLPMSAMNGLSAMRSG